MEGTTLLSPLALGGPNTQILASRNQWQLSNIQLIDELLDHWGERDWILWGYCLIFFTIDWLLMYLHGIASCPQWFPANSMIRSKTDIAKQIGIFLRDWSRGEVSWSGSQKQPNSDIVFWGKIGRGGWCREWWLFHGRGIQTWRISARKHKQGEGIYCDCLLRIWKMSSLLMEWSRLQWLGLSMEQESMGEILGLYWGFLQILLTLELIILWLWRPISYRQGSKGPKNWVPSTHEQAPFQTETICW